MTDIKRYQLDACWVCLGDFDHLAKSCDFMEVALWHNGEGFDVHLMSTNSEQIFRLSWGEFKALKKLIKELDG